MLTTRHLTKGYGSLLALDDVSLTLEPGEFFGLLGPNGAGKTLLMCRLSQHLALQSPPDLRVTLWKGKRLDRGAGLVPFPR